MANRVSYIIQIKDRFSAASRRIRQGFDSVERGAERANRKLKEFEKRGENIRKMSGRFAKVGAAMAAGVTLPAALMGRSMVNAASDAVETANKFDNVFDDVRDKANRVASDFATSFGTAGSTARKLIGDTGDLLVGFGFSGDAALDLSKRVNELASDLTSFQNVEGGVSRASEALTKALLGETESAKSLGIVIRQNDPAFKMRVKLLQRTQGLTEQQAKAETIFQVALSQSRKAVGDTARTWDDYASVQRRNAQRAIELREEFGKQLLPTALKLQQIAEKLMISLQGTSPATKKIMLAIAGLLAVGGPLLILFAGIAAAITFISGPMILIAGGIALLTAGIVALAVKWDDITAKMTDVWVKLSDMIGGTIEQILINFEEFKKKLSLGNIKDSIVGGVKSFFGVEVTPKAVEQTASAATVQQRRASNVVPLPVAPNSGRIDGQITVSAQPGSKVENTTLRTSGKNLNVGANMNG